MANIIPYRGMQDGIIPNRVWDLPPELGSELEEAEEANSHVVTWRCPRQQRFREVGPHRSTTVLEDQQCPLYPVAGEV